MNTSQFMDKQIMDLANSPNGGDFINLMNPQEDIGSERKEEITPSYDFQPIRPVGSSTTEADNSGARAWNSVDSKNTSGLRNVSSVDSMGPAKTILEKGHNASNEALLSAIDQTMKKYADNLVQTLEGVSSRISQLESRSRHLENVMDDLKISVGSNQGSTDGKLRQLENILREVQSSVQVVKDKQDVVESQLHLAKLQVSKTEQHSEIQNTAQSDSFHHAASVPPQQSYHQLTTPPPPTLQPPSPVVSQPNPPPPPASQQTPPPQVQYPHQFPPNQVSPIPHREPYYEGANQQQYQLPPPQPPQPQPAPPLPAPPQQHYQAPPPPHPQYSQPPPPPQPQPQPSSLGHRPEEPPYPPPSHNFPPNVSHPTAGNSPSQQFYGAPPSHMYEPPSSRINNSGFPSAYGPPPSGPNEPFPYGGSHQYMGGGGGPPSLSSSGSMKQQGGGSSYPPQLPTARILPQGSPTAAAIGGGSGSSGGGGNRVPIDDVVDKVTTMGFSRDQVRATVRKLTESGQTVDLNAVLDKLMNEGDGQPPRGWFGR